MLRSFALDRHQSEERSRPPKALGPARNATRWLLPLVLVPHLLVAAYFGGRFIDYPDPAAYLSVAQNILACNRLSLSFDGLARFIKKSEPTFYFGFGTPVLLAAP